MAQTSSLPPTAPPEVKAPSALVWVRKNLFSTWYNGIITVVCLIVIVLGLSSFISWVFGAAQWEVINANLRLFFVGQFPQDLYWRIWMCLLIVAGLSGLSWGIARRNAHLFSRPALIALGVTIAAVVLVPIGLPPRLWLLATTLIGIVGYGVGRQLPLNVSRWLTVAWGLAFLVILWFIKGGLGLEVTPTSLWSGLLLSLFTAIVSIVLSFPLGVMLALGRQSNLPVVRLFSILYIEVIRGLPLIGILFLAQVMLPLFLPPGFTSLDRVLRAIAGLVLFNSAYLAENVRGGLQSLPRGQSEAGRALGLSGLLVIVLIVLPQALRAVIPSLVGEFIGLFKDTSLLALFGLLELTGIARSILAQPQFLGRYAEVYLFIGFIYWILCYAMSLGSQRLEKNLNVGH